MKIKKASLTISKTIQVQQFEPLKIEATVECEIENDKNMEDSFDKLRDSIVGEIDYTIDKMIEKE